MPSVNEFELSQAEKYADQAFPEGYLSPENEYYADISVESYLGALESTPWAVYQVRNSDHEVESVIARFQHQQLAQRFLSAIKPITGHYLRLEGPWNE